LDVVVTALPSGRPLSQRSCPPDGTDLTGLMVALTLRYFDRVQPSTKWEVVIYVDERADDDQLAALSSIFLGRAGGTVAAQYAPAIGDVHAIRRARITVEHLAPRKRIDLTAYILLEAEETASEPGEVACGIPGLDRPGTELWSPAKGTDLRPNVRCSMFDVRTGNGRGFGGCTSGFHAAERGGGPERPRVRILRTGS
jgi:hypothetical protein